MTEVLRSLTDVSNLPTVYTQFEKDQLLTDKQLNGLADYLDGQDRLTRIGLIGVGIACGLQPSLRDGAGVNVSRGVGVTTDGDLIYLAADAVYNRFKPYDAAAPIYSSFHPDGMTFPMFELVLESAEDA